MERFKQLTKNSEKSKKIYIEVLRCIAIFCVVFNHTGTKGFQLYATTDNEFLYIVYLIMAILCKIAVPIFFMISGALLLKKEESIKTLYKKRVLRMIIVIIIASFVQYMWKIKMDFTQIDIIKFIKDIYSKPIIGSYWFLYSYLIFLIILPFLRNIVKNMEKRQYYYLFIIIILFKMIVPIISKILHVSITDRLSIPLLDNNVVFPIVGYFCDSILDIREINKKVIAIMTAITSMVVAGAVIMTILTVKKVNDVYIQTYLNYGWIFVAMYVYIIIKRIFSERKLPNIISKIILTIGGCSFGVYLMEEILRAILFNRIFMKLSPIIKSMPACIMTVCCIVIIGTFITAILKKVPYINRLL